MKNSCACCGSQDTVSFPFRDNFELAAEGSVVQLSATYPISACLTCGEILSDEVAEIEREAVVASYLKKEKYGDGAQGRTRTDTPCGT